MVDLPKSVDHQRRTAPAAHCPQNGRRAQPSSLPYLLSAVHLDHPPRRTNRPESNENNLSFFRFDKRTGLSYPYAQQNQFVF